MTYNRTSACLHSSALSPDWFIRRYVHPVYLYYTCVWACEYHIGWNRQTKIHILYIYYIYRQNFLTKRRYMGRNLCKVEVTSGDSIFPVVTMLEGPECVFDTWEFRRHLLHCDLQSLADCKMSGITIWSTLQ